MIQLVCDQCGQPKDKLPLHVVEEGKSPRAGESFDLCSAHCFVDHIAAMGRPMKTDSKPEAAPRRRNA